MNKNVLFFDTYAFFEILNGNPNYNIYREFFPITSIFNLAELNYCLKKDFDERTADKFTDAYAYCVVDVDIEDIKKAMNLKLKNKKMSIPDVIGYALARKLGIKFLTGDKEFKDIPEVEFVK